MVYKFFDKKIRSGARVNEELAQELRKPVIRKFQKRRVYARFKNNIWAADLAEKGSISSKNRDVKYLLCVIDVFTKYAWVKHLKDKTAKAALHGFIEIVDKSIRQPRNLCVDQGIEFYNSPMQK